MLQIAILIGSTRPGRKAEAVARWVHDIAKQRKDVTFELVDLLDYHLPLLDEPIPPGMGQYAQEHTKVWSAKIASFDAFVFVTPEYNHGIPGALKNAIDFLYREWNNKAAGFVAYGNAGGTRSVEQLRLVMGELQVADVRAQVALSLQGQLALLFQPGDCPLLGCQANGWLEPQGIQQAIEHGAQEFIMKPFDEEILLGKFAQVGLL